MYISGEHVFAFIFGGIFVGALTLGPEILLIVPLVLFILLVWTA